VGVDGHVAAAVVDGHHVAVSAADGAGVDDRAGVGGVNAVALEALRVDGRVAAPVVVAGDLPGVGGGPAEGAGAVIDRAGRAGAGAVDLGGHAAAHVARFQRHDPALLQLTVAAGDHDVGAGFDDRVGDIQVIAGIEQNIFDVHFVEPGDMVELVAVFPLVEDAVHRRDLEGHAGGDQVRVVMQHAEVCPQDALGLQRIVLCQAEKRVAGFHLDLSHAFTSAFLDLGFGIAAARQRVGPDGGIVVGQGGGGRGDGRGAPDAAEVCQQGASGEKLVEGETHQGDHHERQQPGSRHQPDGGGAGLRHSIALIGRFFAEKRH